MAGFARRLPLLTFRIGNGFAARALSKRKEEAMFFRTEDQRRERGLAEAARELRRRQWEAQSKRLAELSRRPTAEEAQL